jgi:membrane protease subunit (stomatin/prohibitin family)
MGFMEKLRAELVDIIEWVDDSRHTLVWRFPRYHNQIKYGAQLIVRPGQSAVFVHQGQIADVFGPGQHTLHTSNMPLLSTLAGWYHGFDSPFKAEVYFVSTRQVADLKWGTPNPVLMRDPDFGPIRVRAFGTYTLRATDPGILLKELVGTDSVLETDEVTELLRAVINQAFADVVAKSEIPILDLASNYAEIAGQVRDLVVARIDDEYGLEMPQLFLVNVSVPAEVEEALDVRSSMGVIGDLGAFQAYQMGQAIPAAAENPAGGLAGAGVGLGMGMAMANQFGNGPGHLGGGPAPTAGGPPPPPAPPTVWHIAQNGETAGPFTAAQLAQSASAGSFRGDTHVWTAGMAGWLQASEVPALAPVLANVPPPPPPAGPGRS